MIMTSAMRWCQICGRMEVHDVESHVTRGKQIEDAQTCHRCLKRRLTPRLSRSELQNGGGGDVRYRGQRAKL
jgi:hypothetical protein